MSQRSQDRFKDVGWFGYPVDVIIGGAGGIGSWIALLVSRLGYKSFVYDMDHIEDHNIGTQFYTKHQNGASKAYAVQTNCEDYGGINIVGMNLKYEQNSAVSSVMMSGFDNMEARKLFFNNWKNHVLSEGISQESVKIFIDGRMTAETGQIYFVKTKKEIELYESTLFNDSEVDDGPCSYKATPHNGPLIASLMVSGLVSAVYNKAIGQSVRHIPFETSFRIPEFIIESKTSKEFSNGVDK